MSVYMDIIEGCVEHCRTQVDLSGVGDSKGIPREHVIPTIMPHRYNQKQELLSDTTPGVVWSPGHEVQVPISGGNNKQMDVYYPVLCQMVWTVSERWPRDQVATMLQIHENIRRYFYGGNLRSDVYSTAGYMTLAWQDGATSLREIARYDNSVMVIPFVFKSREPHNTEGRT